MSNLFTPPFEDLDSNWRFETKYRISAIDYFAIKNALAPFMKPDFYTKSSPKRKYLVRSLYFDTHDYRFYIEKIDGDCNRIKFRIRTYGTDPKEKPDIRVEMKVRKGNTMEKYGCFVSFEDYRVFMDKHHWRDDKDPVLIDFTRYVRKWNLQPKTLVQYDREGFHSRTLDGIRLTFDHRIKSAPSKELFPTHEYWRRHYASQIVLEIKHQNNIPGWLENMIQSYHMKVIPNSKYANSIEVAPRDIIFP
jgi:hypothetical protein